MRQTSRKETGARQRDSNPAGSNHNGGQPVSPHPQLHVSAAKSDRWAAGVVGTPRRCAACASALEVPANNPRKRYCSPRCRVADWHRTHDRLGDPLDVALHGGAPSDTPSGVGDVVPNGVTPANGVNAARCPHCHRPVAVVSLLLAPAAAHVRTPEPAEPGHG